jgi:hypothetical protein
MPRRTAPKMARGRRARAWQKALSVKARPAINADFHGRENNQSSYGCRGQW